MPELLLLSNSTNHGSGYLAHAVDEITAFLDGVTELLFVPYAGADHDAYTEQVSGPLAELGIAVRGLHTFTTPDAAEGAVASAQAIFVGGGNTFRLVKALQDGKLLDPIRAAVLSGTRYMGASAGTNIADPAHHQ
jgi:dipeptidase E